MTKQYNNIKYQTVNNAGHQVTILDLRIDLANTNH